MAAGLLLWLFVGGVTIRPYVPPKLDPEPELTPSEVKVVEIAPTSADPDAVVLARPSYAAPLAGHVLRGARVPVRGEVVLPSKGGNGCGTRLYYALEPVGYICSSEARPTAKPATSSSVLQVVEGTPLPFRYAMVLVEEESSLPMWGSLEALREHAEPERQLSRGDTIALAPEPRVEIFEGEKYYVSVDDKVLPVRSTTIVQHYSQWQGEQLTAATHLPFGWVNPAKAPIYDAPDGTKIDQVEQRTRLEVLEEQEVKKSRWLRVGDGRWIKEKHLNEVRKITRPEGTGQHAQWFDVDLGEQVVVAYENDQPVYATLTASGHEPNHTPRGNYPIWGKVTSITMKSQEYDDKPYYVNRVPWVMFFQAHNALHGAYWHDRFGNTKSHGCVNLAPKDARYLFDWLQPNLPLGWTSIRYWDLTEAPVAHVHNSHQRRDIFQERNVGPPNKNDEAERLTKAIAKREAEAAAAAAAAEQAAAGVPGTPGAPGTLPAPGSAPIVPMPAAVPVATPPAAPAAPSAPRPASTTSLTPGLQPTAAGPTTAMNR
jgi:hypothetical protein